MDAKEKYIPALRFRLLTPLYDHLLRWGMDEGHFKQALVRQAHIQPGHQILDVGCGTATLTIQIKKTYPDTQVIGLDGDLEVLKIGRTKAAKARVEVTLDQGLADKLPYLDQTFHRVFSSLMFHHLTFQKNEKP